MNIDNSTTFFCAFCGIQGIEKGNLSEMIAIEICSFEALVGGRGICGSLVTLLTGFATFAHKLCAKWILATNFLKRANILSIGQLPSCLVKRKDRYNFLVTAAFFSWSKNRIVHCSLTFRKVDSHSLHFCRHIQCKVWGWKIFRKKDLETWKFHKFLRILTKFLNFYQILEISTKFQNFNQISLSVSSLLESVHKRKKERKKERERTPRFYFVMTLSYAQSLLTARERKLEVLIG